LRGVVQRFEDLSYLPSCSEVHPEARHGTASGQADHTEETKHNDVPMMLLLLSMTDPNTLLRHRCQFSYLRHRVLSGCPLFRPVVRYSKSSVNSWFSPNSTTSLKCFTCWTTVYSCKHRDIPFKEQSVRKIYLFVCLMTLECCDRVLSSHVIGRRKTAEVDPRPPQSSVWRCTQLWWETETQETGECREKR
ncbi:hypothetical protein XENOCAPTIV_014774, partial [Xenoophorus captivus]